MNSRNPKTEARELGTLKNPPIVCVCRHYDKPIPKWKADLHAFALSFLPAVVAFIMTLVFAGPIGSTFCIGLVLYAIMVITVALFKYHSTKDDNKVLDGIFLRIIGLVVVAFLLAAVGIILGILSGDPVIQGWVTLIGAAVTAIISQKTLALDPDYLVKAKKAPPLFSDREKTVWKKAAAVYGVLAVVTLPRLLPENILNMLRQLSKLGIEAIGSNIPCAIGILLAGVAIVALIYPLYRLYRLYRRFK
ncbi:hypothetical protein [Corynebacterium casei]|uniref:hypothetical protein n=1 Tax=Corynebacterium casei TaxID=160386 RepID=UPI003FD69D30